MSNVAPGQILVADHNGIHVIKMLGDVRLTLCIPFDDFIEGLFQQDDFCTVLFDFVDATGMDSTTLGLVAKLAVKVQSKKQINPIAICGDDSIRRLLVSMGLDEVCELIDDLPKNYCETQHFVSLDVPEKANDEEYIRSKVLESHCILMGLNETNRETFKDLVQTLQFG